MAKSNWKSRDAHVTLDELCKTFKLETVEDFQDRISGSGDGIYHVCYTEALRDIRASDNEISDEDAEAKAEEIALKAESDELGEMVTKYHDAVLAAVRKLFEKHNLALEESKRDCFKFKIVPTESWRDSAGKIIETINGYGMFHFSNVREFCDSGPYTPKESVLNHWHWIKEYPAVYGDRDARSMVESALRY